MEGTRAKTVSRNSISTVDGVISALHIGGLSRITDSLLTFISQDHKVNVDALAMVPDGLEGITLWVRHTARLAQSGEFQIKGSTDKRLDDAIEKATNKPKRQDRVFGATRDALFEDGVNELARELIHDGLMVVVG